MGPNEMTAERLCRHFGACGGCTYQDLPPGDYRQLKRQLVVDALARESIDAPVEGVVEVPPATRRRATFKVEKREGETLIGFHAPSSHAVVDMHECLVLTRELVVLVPRLREMMSALLKEGEKAELYVVEADNGFDLALTDRKPGPALTRWAAQWAKKLDIVRVTAGGQIVIELAAPTIAFGRATLRIPPQCFLQPTHEGEEGLAALVLGTVGPAKSLVELFAGIGTLTLRLAEHARVHAFDADQAALDALAAAARATPKLKPIETTKRDLFRSPLSAAELKAFDAVVLDPPRAGAEKQARELARSGVSRIAYVSCNPASFARDTRLLADGGYRLESVTPVDQFLWSSHIELVGRFSRDRAWKAGPAA